MHFAGKNNDQIRKDKNFISKIETLDGEVIDKKLRFNNFSNIYSKGKNYSYKI